MPKRIVFKIDNERVTSGGGPIPPVSERTCDLDLTDIVPISTLTLKQVMVKIDESTDVYDFLNIYISGIIGKKNVIDCDKGFNFLEIPLSKDRVYSSPVSPDVPELTNVQWTRYSTDESFTMASPLENQVEFKVLNKYYELVPAEDLKFIMLVFEYTDPATNKPEVVYTDGVRSLRT